MRLLQNTACLSADLHQRLVTRISLSTEFALAQIAFPSETSNAHLTKGEHICFCYAFIRHSSRLQSLVHVQNRSGLCTNSRDRIPAPDERHTFRRTQKLIFHTVSQSYSTVHPLHSHFHQYFHMHGHTHTHTIQLHQLLVLWSMT